MGAGLNVKDLLAPAVLLVGGLLRWKLVGWMLLHHHHHHHHGGSHKVTNWTGLGAAEQLLIID